jgi:hypothetical protein
LPFLYLENPSSPVLPGKALPAVEVKALAMFGALLGRAANVVFDLNNLIHHNLLPTHPKYREGN